MKTRFESKLFVLFATGLIAACAQPGALPAVQAPTVAPSNHAHAAAQEHKPNTGISLAIHGVLQSSDRVEVTVIASVDSGPIDHATIQFGVVDGAVIEGQHTWELDNLTAGAQVTRSVMVRRTTATEQAGAHVVASIQVRRPGEAISDAIGEWFFGVASAAQRTRVQPGASPVNAMEATSAPVGSERLIRTPQGVVLHDTVVR